jgi:PilZ domain
MSSTTQGSDPRRLVFDGRLEKRVPVAVKVYVEGAKEPRASEKAFTENVSPRGARVWTKQTWPPGEELRITPLTSDFPHPARVVYCHPRKGGGFCIGVEFDGSSVKWGDLSAGNPQPR